MAVCEDDMSYHMVGVGIVLCRRGEGYRDHLLMSGHSASSQCGRSPLSSGAVHT